MDNLNKVGVAAFCLFLLALGYVSLDNYMHVSDTCNGVVVYDAMNQPACIQNPNVAIPIYR